MPPARGIDSVPSAGDDEAEEDADAASIGESLRSCMILPSTSQSAAAGDCRW